MRLRAVAAATREAFAGVDFLEAVESGGTAAALAARSALVGRVRAEVDAVRLEDFGGAVLGAGGGSPELPRDDAGGRWPEVKYQHVGHGAGYSMGVFVLPPSGCIPLHSHPEMAVVSKLLYGDLRVRSYTFADGAHDASLAALAAGGVARAVMTERSLSASGSLSPLLSLSPTEGNLHEFSTVGGCAIFDVLAPPYDDDAGRSCVYYRHDAEEAAAAEAAAAAAAVAAAAEPRGGGGGGGVEVLLQEWPDAEMLVNVGGGPSLSYLIQ